MAEDGRPAQRLTMRLIRECNASHTGPDGTSADEVAADLMNRRVVRLDWQRIEQIENLDAFSHVQELYLQHNRIEKIEELGALTELTFLALGSNRIRRVNNLRHLKQLQLLDLSNNQIEDLDTEELPRGLMILDLRGNACCSKADYREGILAALPHLQELDGRPVDPVAARSDNGQHGDEEELDGRPAAWSENGQHGGEEVKQSEKIRPGRAGPASMADHVDLYVTVHEESGNARVVPLSFSPHDDLQEVAQQFCEDHVVEGSGCAHALLLEMEAAAIETRTGARRALEERKERADEAVGGDVSGDEDEDATPGEGRVRALRRVEDAHARLLEESTMVFAQEKAATLERVKESVARKTKAAHGRADELREDVIQVLSEAREGVRRRREQISRDSRKFSEDLRVSAKAALEERRETRSGALAAYK